jgi:metallo-beta-lactamase class B
MEETVQLVPNVFLVNGFPYGQHQNSYAVRLDDEWVMIDAGDLESETFDLLQANASLWGIRLEQVRCLLVTHAHFDHASHAARLQRMGVQIVANQDGADALASGDDRCIGYAVGQRFEPCEVDRVIRDGDALEVGAHVIRCIEAPGHANSCVVYEILLDGRRLWFVGDVILTGPECQGVELGWNGGPDYERGTYLRTLERLCHMECDALFPGHGPPCLGNGKRLVEMAYTKAMMEWR